MNTYYKDQLAKIDLKNSGTYANIKITKDDTGTNWLPLNNESASEIVAFLKANFNVVEETDQFGGNWCHEDIRSRATEMYDRELTTEDCIQIVGILEKNNDASVGINWDTIDEAIDIYLED